MSDSSLVTYTKLSPNCTSPRKNDIDRITIHMVVGQVTCERLGEIFAPKSRQASSNYGVCTNGIGLYCHESDRSWCSGTGNAKNSNDHRAVCIECASDTKYPYAVKDDVYERLIDLCVDICKRNGKNRLIWIADKDKALAYKQKDTEMLLTLHKWFQNTSCPGYFLESHMGDIAEKVNAQLNSGSEERPATCISVGEKITTIKDYKGYNTAADAIAKKESSLLYKKGEYFVYKIYVDKNNSIAYNISRRKNTAGAWVVL